MPSSTVGNVPFGKQFFAQNTSYKNSTRDEVSDDRAWMYAVIFSPMISLLTISSVTATGEFPEGRGREGCRDRYSFTMYRVVCRGSNPLGLLRSSRCFISNSVRVRSRSRVESCFQCVQTTETHLALFHLGRTENSFQSFDWIRACSVLHRHHQST